MKQLLLFFAVLFVSVAAYAQSPFMVYKPLIVPETSNDFHIPQMPDFEDPLEEARRQYAAQARANEIVSSDIITADGFNLISEVYSPLKVNVIRRRSGKVEYHCLGIKKSGTWKPCQKEIASLETMYKMATKDSDKAQILELMEYGNFLLIINPKSEVYIIK